MSNRNAFRADQDFISFGDEDGGGRNGSRDKGKGRATSTHAHKQPLRDRLSSGPGGSGSRLKLVSAPGSRQASQGPPRLDFQWGEASRGNQRSNANHNDAGPRAIRELISNEARNGGGGSQSGSSSRGEGGGNGAGHKRKRGFSPAAGARKAFAVENTSRGTPWTDEVNWETCISAAQA